MLERTDTQWAALQSGACPPFQGLNPPTNRLRGGKMNGNSV